MDKRLLLFVVSLSAALFVVNLYFQNQHEEELRAWNTQQAAKKEFKVKQLEEEIQSSTIAPSSLPIVNTFSDEAQKQQGSKAIFDGKNLIIHSSEKAVPEVIFYQNSNFILSKDAKLPLGFHLYKEGADAELKVAELPDFGQFDLQLVDLSTGSVNLGRYVDGAFSLPLDAVEKLKKEIQPETSKTKAIQNSIALVKVEGVYLPAALYDAEHKKLIGLDEIEGVKALPISPQGKSLPAASSKTEEQYYVLENTYQQLVFTNYGGALAEINLPFQSKNDTSSVVKEIEYDRDMVAHHPQNAYFPSHAYFTASDSKDNSFIKHDKGTLGGYYPLIRRDLIQDEGRKTVKVHPRFYALNIVSEYPEVAELVYEVKKFTQNQIVFEAKQSHRTITKTYTIVDNEGGPYCLDLTIKIEGDSRGLWLTSGVPEIEWISGGPAPALKYRITRQNKADVEPVDLPQDALTISSVLPDWICNSNGFFGLIMDPLTEINSGLRATMVSGAVVPSRLVEIDQEYNLFPAEKMPGYLMMLPLKTTGGVMQFRIFAGPFASSVLKKVDETYSNKDTGYNPDYIACQTFHGWFSFISEPFAKFLFFLMKTFYSFTGSWAFSIILLTIALRLMLYPLNAWSIKSTLQMQKIAPEIKAIQEKHKKDPKKAQLEIVNLYRERGINPLSGCLPLLIQMPFLIGMFDLLKSTFELRGASFIPGWIEDLSAPDVLFSWNYPIFFIGNELHLLPFLLGAVMFFQQRMMSPLPSDPNQMTDQQRQQRAMGNMMTVVFTLMFYNFPSGLNIYWLSSMILGMIQQWWTNRTLKASPVKTPALHSSKGGKR